MKLKIGQFNVEYTDERTQLKIRGVFIFVSSAEWSSCDISTPLSCSFSGVATTLALFISALLWVYDFQLPDCCDSSIKFES